MTLPLAREIEGLERILGSDRDPDGRAFVPLADAHRRHGELDLALRMVEEGLSRHPELASGHVVSAWIHRDRGDRELARASWERVLELDADNVEALRGMGTLLLESGRTDEARSYLEKARSLDPSDAPEPEAPPEAPVDELPVLAAGADALLETVRHEEIWPTSAEQGESIWPAAAAPEDPDEHAEVPEPSELPATRTLAELFARQGLYDRAAEIYERLLEERPHDSVLRARLEELRGRLQESGAEPLLEPEQPEERAEPEDRSEPAEPTESEELFEMQLLREPFVAEEPMTPFAWAAEEPAEPEPAGTGGETIGAYFRRLLAWAPSEARAEPVPERTPTETTVPEEPAPDEPAPLDTPMDVLPVEALAPEAVPVASLAPDVEVVSIESLAPAGGVVPIESLAPAGAE